MHVHKRALKSAVQMHVTCTLAYSARLCRLYFPDKGLKRGSKGNREGCDTWTTTLTAGQREFIKAAAYYNMDKAVDKLAQKRSGKRKDAFETGVFSADNFLVRCQLNAITKRLRTTCALLQSSHR